MNFYINGKKAATTSDLKLTDLLKESFSTKGSYAVAINGEFVPKSKYKTIIINSEDKIEVVSPHPGG